MEWRATGVYKVQVPGKVYSFRKNFANWQIERTHAAAETKRYDCEKRAKPKGANEKREKLYLFQDPRNIVYIIREIQTTKSDKYIEQNL